MPRAKRTNRAEARRRYRASIGEPIEDEAFDEAAPRGGGPIVGAEAAGRHAGTSQPGQRLSGGVPAAQRA